MPIDLTEMSKSASPIYKDRYERMSEDKGSSSRMSMDRGSGQESRMSEERFRRMSIDRGSVHDSQGGGGPYIFERTRMMSPDRSSAGHESRASIDEQRSRGSVDERTRLVDERGRRHSEIPRMIVEDRGRRQSEIIVRMPDERMARRQSEVIGRMSMIEDRPKRQSECGRMSEDRGRRQSEVGSRMSDDRSRERSMDRERERERDRDRDRERDVSRERSRERIEKVDKLDKDWSDRERERDGRRSACARSSISSQESDTHAAMVSMSKRWTTLETVGRCMFLLSVAFFIAGVLITVFGFSNTGIGPNKQLPLQIIGPSCLAMTVVMWVIGCVFSRLWNLEWKRQKHAFELRDRVQLHALAMDILHNPVISPGTLQDPGLRRQLLHKLRAQRTLDLNSDYDSRRPSRAMSIDSRRRYSSVQYEKLLQSERKKSNQSCVDFKPSFELPGIQISRIETLDFGDSRCSLASGSTRSRNSRQYIIIHSDMASDFSRLSCPSDYSLAGSRSSRSRGSRASSQLSSRLWDFSPRESDWDADISLGSRESQLSVLRQEWAGDYYREDCLSPLTPRKLSVVTFDTSPTFRRHSSPAFANRRKESGGECTCGRGDHLNPDYPPSIMRNRDMSCHSLRFSDGIRIVETTARKRSADLISCRSLRIQEDEREHIPTSETKDTTTTTSSDTNPNNIQRERSLSGSRPPLRRNNTDDSEVERRVARLFKEIEYSVSESVDESKVHSFSSEFEYSGKRIEAKEAQTQTMPEQEMRFLEVGTSGETSRKNSSDARQSETSPSRGSHSSEVGIEEGGSSKEGHGAKKKKSRSFEKTLSTITNALAQLGRRSHSTETRAAPRGGEQRQHPPRSLLYQGLSVDIHDEDEGKLEPPTYEDVVNKNL